MPTEANTTTDPVIAVLREYLAYDAETGVFTWRLPPAKRVKAGDVAGSHSQGYLRIKLRGREYKAHRVAWAMTHGRWPEKELDHINRVRDDNRMANLRECSAGENRQNIGHAGLGNNRLLGASFNKAKGRFKARIHANHREINLGYFDTEEEAHAAYLAAKRRLHTFNPEIAT